MGVSPTFPTSPSVLDNLNQVLDCIVFKGLEQLAVLYPDLDDSMNKLEIQRDKMDAIRGAADAPSLSAKARRQLLRTDSDMPAESEAAALLAEDLMRLKVFAYNLQYHRLREGSNIHPRVIAEKKMFDTLFVEIERAAGSLEGMDGVLLGMRSIADLKDITAFHGADTKERIQAMALQFTNTPQRFDRETHYIM